MKFSTDKMKDLMEIMKEETPEAFESNPYEMKQDDQSEDDTDMTKFFRALSVQRLHINLTKLNGELEFKLPSSVLELEFTNTDEKEEAQDAICKQVAAFIKLNTQIRRLKMDGFSF